MTAGVTPILLLNGHLLAVGQRILRKFVAKAGKLWHCEFTIDRLILVDAQAAHEIGQGIDVVLMDKEVGDRGLQLKGRSSGQGAGADVELDV